jgi:hypothetical protein
MYRAMSDAIDTAQNNPDIPCIIITAGSGAFTVRFFRAGGRGGRGVQGILCAQEGLAPLSPPSSPRRSLAQTRRVCRRQ